jgi:hypothetical protein
MARLSAKTAEDVRLDTDPVFQWPTAFASGAIVFRAGYFLRDEHGINRTAMDAFLLAERLSGRIVIHAQTQAWSG